MTDEGIIAYLLEELPEDARERFEEECFAEDNWPTQISAVEEDLIEDYLRNQLTPERRQRFERHYLTTEARQQRVCMAAALLRHIDERNALAEGAAAALPKEGSKAEPSRTFWRGPNWALRTAAAMGLVAVLAGALWFLFFRAPAPPTFATLTLTISNSDRAAGPQIGHIKLPANIDALKISLLLPQQSPPAAHYRVTLENEDGENKAVEMIGSEAQSVLVMVPADQLMPGRYMIKIFAVPADGPEQRVNGGYYFIVE